MAGSFLPPVKPTSAFAQPSTGSFSPAQTLSKAAPVAPGPGTPEYAAGQAAGAASAGAAASKAGDFAAATHAMTPAQTADYSRWMTMTPQQQQEYVRGQAQAQTSAGAAADAAGRYQAGQVGPGGPQSAGVQADAKAAVDAKAADDARQEAATKAGLDFMTPGPAQAFQSAHGDEMLAPSKYAGWLEQNRVDPNKQTMQQEFATRTLGQSHGVGAGDFDTYYDRSEQNATQKLNDQLSARGTYGTSVGLGQIGSMLADMEGNRARDKASYGLSRSADDRSWASTQGDLAAGADSSGISRWATAADAEMAGSKEATDRWKIGETAAVDAENAKRNRGQDLFNNNMTLGSALSSTAGGAYGAELAQDQGLVDGIVSMGLAKDAEGVAQIIQRANQNDAQAKQIVDLAMAMKASNQPSASQAGPTGGRA